MTEVKIPEPDTHCLDTDTGLDVWSHSTTQLKQYGDDRAREALDMAADTLEHGFFYDDDHHIQYSAEIRALAKEIK